MKKTVRTSCPVHGDYDITIERVQRGETVYEDKSSVGYSRRYADAWDRIFGRAKGGKA